MIFGGRGLGFADKAPKHQGEAAGNTSRSIEVIMTRDIAMHRAVVAVHRPVQKPASPSELEQKKMKSRSTRLSTATFSSQ